MKIVRPEQPIVQKEEPKKEENLKVFIDGHEVTTFDDNYCVCKFQPSELIPISKPPQTIEEIMNNVLEENTNTVSFQITLTKKQYELWNKKGGLSWLKKALLGQVRTTKRKKK